MNRSLALLTLSITAVLLAGCGKDTQPGATGPVQPAAPLGHLPAAEIKVTDVADIQPGYNIGVSFDPAVGQFEPLHQQVQSFVDQQTQAFKSALGATPAVVKDPAHKPTLSLYLVSVANTPAFAAVAANGSMYTGKGAATPIVQRWVYLPGNRQMVSVQQMFPDSTLNGVLAARGASGQLIGMEPVANAQGKITEVRFVYQLGASDHPEQAVHKVLMPAADLKRLIAPTYSALLAD